MIYDLEKIKSEICEKAVLMTGETLFKSSKDDYDYQEDVVNDVINGKQSNLRLSFCKLCAETFAFFIKQITADALNLPISVFDDKEYWKEMNLMSISDYSSYHEKLFYKYFENDIKKFINGIYDSHNILVESRNIGMIKDFSMNDTIYVERGYTLKRPNDAYLVRNISHRLTIKQILVIMSASTVKE